MKRALCLAALLVLAGVGGATTTVTLDADTDLTDRETIEHYEEHAVASTDSAAPELRITVAESHEDVGIDGLVTDSHRTYVRLQYNETVERTIRFYVPSEYFYPVRAEGETAFNSDLKAEFKPVEGGRYTSVTVHLTNTTDSVWTVKKVASGVFFFQDKYRDVLENQTGVAPPRLAEGEEWAYIPPGALTGNTSTYPVNRSEDGELTLQYDSTADTVTESTWVPVPECGDGGGAPVCTFEKEGVEGKVFVLSKTASPPDVRFKNGRTITGSGKSGLNDFLDIWGSDGRFWSDIGSLFGGGT
jgi:hypothetical protein